MEESIEQFKKDIESATYAHVLRVYLILGKQDFIDFLTKKIKEK